MLHKLNINNGSNISAAGAMGQDPDPAGAKTENRTEQNREPWAQVATNEVWMTCSAGWLPWNLCGTGLSEQASLVLSFSCIFNEFSPECKLLKKKLMVGKTPRSHLLFSGFSCIQVKRNFNDPTAKFIVACCCGTNYFYGQPHSHKIYFNCYTLWWFTLYV